MHFIVEIEGPIDSLSLWKMIEKYRVNLTDLIGTVYVYGKADTIVVMEVIVCCALYGKLKIELSWGAT